MEQQIKSTQLILDVSQRECRETLVAPHHMCVMTSGSNNSRCHHFYRITFLTSR
jgi:hypothetical protein